MPSLSSALSLNEESELSGRVVPLVSAAPIGPWQLTQMRLGSGYFACASTLREHLVALGDHERAGHGVRVHRALPFLDRARVAIGALVGALEAAQAAAGDRAERQRTGRHVVGEKQMRGHRQQKIRLSGTCAMRRPCSRKP